MRRKTRPGDLSLGVVVTALVAPAPLALLAGVVLAQRLPLAREAAFAVGLHAIVPLYVVVTCLLLLAGGGRRVAWWTIAPLLALSLAAWAGS